MAMMRGGLHCRSSCLEDPRFICSRLVALGLLVAGPSGRDVKCGRSSCWGSYGTLVLSGNIGHAALCSKHRLTICS